MAAYLGSRFQPALAVLPRGEEVERRAAAVPGLAAPARAANDDSVAGLPAAHAVGIELDLYLLLRKRIARGDLDRLLEHRRDPERVDRAHRIRLVPSLETNAMCRRTTRERVRDGNLKLPIEMGKVLPRERLERSRGVEPEPPARLARLRAARAAAGREAAQDPEVELALRVREPGMAGGPELGRRDRCSAQRSRHARR